MNISTNYFGTNFKGLYEKTGIIKRKKGQPHYNKEVYKLYDFTYHPYEDESKEDIEKELKKTNWGRAFGLSEGYDHMYEGRYYYMNRIKVGDRIKRSNEDEYIEKGYTKVPIGIDLDEENFNNTYNNNQYATSSLDILKPKDISEIAESIKDSSYSDFN